MEKAPKENSPMGLPERAIVSSVAPMADFSRKRRRSMHEVVHLMKFDPTWGFTIPTERGSPNKAISPTLRRFYAHDNARPPAYNSSQALKWSLRERYAKEAAAMPETVATIRGIKQVFMPKAV
jgi:hypothetical protein